MARGSILGREENGVTVFDAPVLGEEDYVSPPPPVFDGPNGLPTGWSKLTVPFNGKQYVGFMSDTAAVMPVQGGWCVCPVVAGQIAVRKRTPELYEDYVAAIVAAWMTF